jgi:DNA-binding FrmR family transcriptional regulator
VRLSEDTLRDLQARLRRVEGQARGVQRMLEEGRDCAEVLQQLAAIRTAVAKVAMALVAEQLADCLREAGPDQPARLARAKRAFLDLV